MYTTTAPYYRLFRPEIPLPVFVRQQSGPVVVHRHDLPHLQQTGAQNCVLLPHGGPQPGEVWLEVQS